MRAISCSIKVFIVLVVPGGPLPAVFHGRDEENEGDGDGGIQRHDDVRLDDVLGLKVERVPL